MEEGQSSRAVVIFGITYQIYDLPFNFKRRANLLRQEEELYRSLFEQYCVFFLYFSHFVLTCSQ